MEKIRKSKWMDFSIFSVKITYLSIVTIIAVIMLVINPSLFYVSLVFIFISTISPFVYILLSSSIFISSNIIRSVSNILQ